MTKKLNIMDKLYYYLFIRMWLPVITAALIIPAFLYEVVYYTNLDKHEYVHINVEYVEPENATEDVSNIEEYKVVDPFDIYEFENVGYIDVNTQLNVREEPSTDSEILTTLTWMNEVHYSYVSDDWSAILMDDNKVGYISSKYITDTLETYTNTYNVSGDKAKTYMDYRTITDKYSRQYALQLRASTNPDNGLRMLRGRYMVAIGSYFNCKVGQFIDVVLSDGEILECIVGDAKQDIHTDSDNLHGLSGDTVEFIVDEKVLKSTTEVDGNISYVSDVFDGKVVEIRTYDHVEK